MAQGKRKPVRERFPVTIPLRGATRPPVSVGVSPCQPATSADVLDVDSLCLGAIAGVNHYDGFSSFMSNTQT
jgi:hypothetical protein